MDGSTSGVGKPASGPVDRRMFLTGLAAFSGGAALAATNAELLVSKSASQNPDAGAPTAAATTAPTLGQRGRILNIRSEITEYKDAKTGARIRQLTSDGSNNVHPYFTSEGFVGDDANHAVFISDRSGSYQWYMLEISSGKLVQLTAGEKIHPNAACLSRNGKLIYFAGTSLRVVHTDTLEDREIYRIPTGFGPGLPTCSADGHYVVFTYRQNFQQSTATGLIYSTMAEEYYQHPHSVSMRIDTATGAAVAIWGEAQWISHTIIHPTQPNIIVFCHEGGSGVVQQRMWVVDLNEKRSRTATPLFPQKLGEGCVHEFFTQTGDVGVQYSIYNGDDAEEFNMFIRPDGSWIRQYRYPGKRPGHFQSNSDNTLCIGDCAYLNPKQGDGNEYLGLMKHNNGEVQIRRLAWHRTSWKTQESHPHPVFSPDDRWVMYNSDIENRYNVYLADVESV